MFNAQCLLFLLLSFYCFKGFTENIAQEQGGDVVMPQV